MKATIYHNPRCSKSRAALALLEQVGAEVDIIDYLRTPPTRAALERLFARARLAARDVLRKDAPAAARLSDAAALDAMMIHPALIERPLVETDKGAVLARPPERVREIL